jgi:photosystem II S4 domain protein
MRELQAQHYKIRKITPCGKLPHLSVVAAIEIKGNFIFDPASHPDFLGAILGTGIQRGKVGDILVLGETGAQALIDPLLLDHFATSLTQVRTVPVKVSRIPLSQLKVREPKMEEVQTVEASTRLDALASFGFKLSRTKMGDLIKAGDVKVNWVVEERTARELKEGDVISCTGRGRLQIGEVDVTKRDRYRVVLKRFV